VNGIAVPVGIQPNLTVSIARVGPATLRQQFAIDSKPVYEVTLTVSSNGKVLSVAGHSLDGSEQPFTALFYKD
jgi:hypothetical protein